MAKALKGEVSFLANGVRYVMVLDWNALCDLESDLEGISEGKIEVSRPTVLRKVVWAALQRDHDDIDEKAAGRLIDAVGAAEMADLVGEAIKRAFPDSGGDDGEGDPRKPAGENRKQRRASASKKR